ncbi:unnamed protein product [Boreogadus saida]
MLHVFSLITFTTRWSQENHRHDDIPAASELFRNKFRHLINSGSDSGRNVGSESETTTKRNRKKKKKKSAGKKKKAWLGFSFTLFKIFFHNKGLYQSFCIAGRRRMMLPIPGEADKLSLHPRVRGMWTRRGRAEFKPLLGAWSP